MFALVFLEEIYEGIFIASCNTNFPTLQSKCSTPIKAAMAVVKLVSELNVMLPHLTNQEDSLTESSPGSPGKGTKLLSDHQ